MKQLSRGQLNTLAKSAAAVSRARIQQLLERLPEAEHRALLRSAPAALLLDVRFLASLLDSEGTAEEVQGWALAALEYFVDPFEMVPDVFAHGYEDDALVVAWIMERIRPLLP